MKSIVILLVSGLSSIIIADAIDNSRYLKLELVQVLFRHGARTPNNVEINTNNYTLAEMYAPLGLGQLTNKGKQQEYEFGRFLRKRYDDYLGTSYKSKDVYTYSSTSARTQMSLQLVLAGLYPPSDSEIWNPRLKWSPIPYEQVPFESDVLLESYKTSTFRKHMTRALDSDQFKRRLAKFSDFFKFVEERTIIKNIDSFWTTHSTFDILIANEFMNMPLPDWYTPEVREKFLEAGEILRDAMIATPKMKRIGVGPLAKAFTENMNHERMIVNPKKLYLYSAHEANISMFVKALNINELKYIHFGSALIFEQLRDLEDKVYVRLLFWNGAGNLSALKLSNKEFCPIGDYLKIVDSIIPSDTEINEMLRIMK
ncbi:venom acid phosphatase Acph-1-like [Phymastichus coffea]|uniref:venom acid phosphatase Acph-1-like n=1 Tax=Phymastichus coffea TaxID=108790 RepID=UPI00273C7C5C|nr:venom acid phosphatase Acph-1-like [Phymastichus coffea]